MFPILFSIGPLTLYSFSLLILCAWVIWSFVFWKSLREYAIEEDKIFDLTFYMTIIGVIVSRIIFVMFHQDLFEDSWLKIAAVWIQPGFSLYGAITGMIVVLAWMSKSVKIRLGMVFDAFARASAWAAPILAIGTFLDGTVAGVETSLPWAMHVVGYPHVRHPVGLYQTLWLTLLIVLTVWFYRKSIRNKLPFGLVGLWYFFLFSIGQFAIEFATVRTVYWGPLSASQWFLIAIFAESLGAFYVRGGGRERIRPIINRIARIRLAFIHKKYEQKT